MLVKIVLCVIVFNLSTAYKVLLVFPTPYKSHAILGEAVVRLLIKAGHEVTYMTPYLIQKSHKNLSQIEVHTKGLFDNAVSINNLLTKEMNTANPFQIFNVIMDLANKTLLDDNVVKLLNDESIHFDVAIIERMFIDVYSGFSAAFNCPYISFFSYHNDMEILELIHDMPNPAYTTNLITSNIPPHSFSQRVKGLFFQFLEVALKKCYFVQKEKELYEIVFKSAFKRRGRNVPDYNDVKYNASIALSTSHISFGSSYVQPLALKLIGGFHIDNVTKPLPKSVQEIMDTSENGVILFSMGSELTFKGMPKQMKSDILRIFSNLKYTVLWKANDLEANIPKNVEIVSWIPQQSVLAHPKCVLFVTHGGILSIAESVHFGVPIVGVPGFGDQFINIRTAVKNGIGIEVELSDDMGDNLKEAIDEVLNNPRYRQRAKELSQIYHSRLVAPGVELVHWVEHVVQTRGAPHLRSPALHMPLYQKCYLDLLAVVLVLLTAISYVVRKIIQRFSKKMFVKKYKKHS